MGLEKPPLRIPLDVQEQSHTRINPSGKTLVGMMLPGCISHPKPHLLKQLGQIPGCFQGEGRGNFHFLGIQGNIPAPLPPGSTWLLQTCLGKPHQELSTFRPAPCGRSFLRESSEHPWIGKCLPGQGMGPGLPVLVFQSFFGNWEAPKPNSQPGQAQAGRAQSRIRLSTAGTRMGLG